MCGESPQAASEWAISDSQCCAAVALAAPTSKNGEHSPALSSSDSERTISDNSGSSKSDSGSMSSGTHSRHATEQGLPDHSEVASEFVFHPHGLVPSAGPSHQLPNFAPAPSAHQHQAPSSFSFHPPVFRPPKPGSELSAWQGGHATKQALDHHSEAASEYVFHLQGLASAAGPSHQLSNFAPGPSGREHHAPTSFSFHRPGFAPPENPPLRYPVFAHGDRTNTRSGKPLDVRQIPTRQLFPFSERYSLERPTPSESSRHTHSKGT